MKTVARRIVDGAMLHLIKMWLEAPVEETDERGNTHRSTRNRDEGRGTPQGAPISPLLSNLYMRRFVLGWKTLGYETRLRAYIVNYADDLVILVDGHPQQAWLLRAVDRRLREELAKLDLTLNEAKSRVVDLTKGEAFGFLGFTFRRLRSKRGKWWAQITPAGKRRAGLLRKLKEVFRRWDSQPVGQVIAEINPILRGWVDYFRIGNATRCFEFVRDWVGKKVRRHLMRAKNRSGFGWRRWSRAWLYETLGLFDDYRVTWGRA